MRVKDPHVLHEQAVFYTATRPQPTFFVIFGASKSGTTWLQRLCDSHPEMVCHFQRPILPIGPKTHPDLWYPIDPVYDEHGNPFKGVFEGDIAEKQYRWTLQFLRQTPILRSSFVDEVGVTNDDEGSRYLKQFHYRMLRGVVAAILMEEPGLQAYGTKARVDLDLLFKVLPEAKVIHLIRDGRDVCVSRRFHMLRRQTLFPGDEKGRALALLNRFGWTRDAIRLLRYRLGWFGRSWFKDFQGEGPLLTEAFVTKFAEEWKRIVHYVQFHESRHPEQFTTVKYEALRATPGDVLGRLFQFLGVDSSPALVQELVEAQQLDRQRDSGSKDSFFRKGAAGDWRTQFREEDRVIFSQIAGPVLIKLGYEDDSSWSTSSPD